MSTVNKIRHDVLQALRGTEGLTRSELVEALGQTDNPSGVQAIYNALNALKMEGAINSDGTRYIPAPQPESTHEGDHV
jgi:Fe2+ or Zn2+ uptake regulation protein